MSAHATEIIPAQPNGTLNIHGIDDENKALLGYLARYTNPRTLANYEMDLRQFREWAHGFGLLRLLDAERWQLELYVRHLIDRGLKPSTVGRRFGTVRGFYHFAHVDGLISKDPAAYVKTPKIESDQQYRTWFSTIDMAIVLRVAEDPREQAILRLMFDLALRVGELCGLNVDSIVRAPTGVFLQFIGKGSKLAVMAVPPSSLYAIDAYLATAGHTDGPLFRNQWGNRLQRRNVQAILDRVSKRAGITYRVTPHGVRRAHARTVVQMGGTYDDAAEDLRHADSRVTRACYAVNTGVGDLGRMRTSAALANLAQ